MKTIGDTKGLTDLEPDLLKFILASCPWIAEDWNAEEIGFVFVLEDSDKVTSVCTVPHIDESDYSIYVKVKLTLDGWSPVYYEGSLYVVDNKENIWVKYPSEKIVRLVAENHDGNSHCARSTDYQGIANHFLMIVTDNTFF